MKRRYLFIPMVALGLVLAQTKTTQAQPQPQAQPTAFALVGKANDYVGVQSKDKVVEIESEKSVGSMQPNVWRVMFYDPDADTRFVEVEFGGSQMTDVSHPMRPFKMSHSANEVIDRSKLKVDSDEAIRIASQQPLVKSLALRASKLTLSRGDIGPAWEVQLWAAKEGEGHDKDIGSVTVSAVDGAVLRSDLHPSRVQ